jgi:hypothetical protein
MVAFISNPKEWTDYRLYLRSSFIRVSFDRKIVGSSQNEKNEIFVAYRFDLRLLTLVVIKE